MITRVVRGLLAVAVLVGVGSFLFHWITGQGTEKVAPGPTEKVLRPIPAGARTLEVGIVSTPLFESAVGSIRAVHEVGIGSRLMARVSKMNVTRAGQLCRVGEILLELDSAELRARLEQASQDSKAAESELSKARVDLARSERLHAQGAEARTVLEQNQVRVQTWESAREKANQERVAIEASLEYAVIRSPIDGVVIDRFVNEGDLVRPGQVLVSLYDPTRMQLVASVREGTAANLSIGDDVDVRLDALDKTCTGTISEIVPQAEATTRAFEVKVTGPCPPGVVSGMFGRIFIPIGVREEIRIPLSAVRSVGQIDMVHVVLEDGRVLRRFVHLGRRTGDEIEVISGISPGETILADSRAIDR